MNKQINKLGSNHQLLVKDTKTGKTFVINKDDAVVGGGLSNYAFIEGAAGFKIQESDVPVFFIDGSDIYISNYPLLGAVTSGITETVGTFEKILVSEQTFIPSQLEALAISNGGSLELLSSSTEPNTIYDVHKIIMVLKTNTTPNTTNVAYYSLNVNGNAVANLDSGIFTGGIDSMITVIPSTSQVDATEELTYYYAGSDFLNKSVTITPYPSPGATFVVGDAELYVKIYYSIVTIPA
jgi:hypothetical protein